MNERRWLTESDVLVMRLQSPETHPELEVSPFWGMSDCDDNHEVSSEAGTRAHNEERIVEESK